MQTAAEIAGMFVTHNLWFLSQGAPTTPMLAYESVDGTRQITRLIMPDAREAVEYGQEWLEENPEHATRAVLIADGFITLDDHRYDAVIFQCRTYVEPTGGFTGAVPYRPKDDPQGFAIYRLKFLAGEEEITEGDRLGEAFFRGVEKHEQGSRVWDEYFDESV